MPYGPPYLIPQLVLDADFLISCHLMKKHDGGHTGAIKNFFGMNSSGKVTFAHSNPGWMDGNQCRTIITHPEIRKRLKLCIDEAILAAKSPDTLDAYQFNAVFPGGKPSSLFLSRNPYLQDVVGWDFVRAECFVSPAAPATPSPGSITVPAISLTGRPQPLKTVFSSPAHTISHPRT